MHKIIFTGNIGDLGGKPVELRRTPREVAYCTFSVAVNPPKGGGEKTAWYTCTFWGRQAEVAAKYAERGKQILVAGRPSVREWADREGRARYSLDVSVSEFEFIGEPPLTSLLREADLLDQVEDARRAAPDTHEAARRP